ncbi:DNA mismatch endonuclease Vsr [Prevotella nigrescens]|uniref:DNA mismatch endonuclease Vsr n=1 Tax=Prevotella nigrescens TaxID=28133 RepID=UPI0002AEBFC4|nr:DNA mismatch endonuclease Vsr [Prevotella nigrescens]ELX66667.1 DNA mismatch endonuclease Vsr [Prevotella nigrescens F0103]QUB55285.1 hypothetical protein J4865_11340 [Prevotella nigrescens F0103]
MDIRTPQQRHRNMAAIHSKDTKPEMLVRKYLWSRGFRYRINNPRLPGKPDIVLRKYRTCIFGKTLEALAYTLNHIYLEDHSSRYKLPEEELLSEMAAEPNPIIE